MYERGKNIDREGFMKGIGKVKEYGKARIWEGSRKGKGYGKEEVYQKNKKRGNDVVRQRFERRIGK